MYRTVGRTIELKLESLPDYSVVQSSSLEVQDAEVQGMWRKILRTYLTDLPTYVWFGISGLEAPCFVNGCIYSYNLLQMVVELL